MLLELEGVQIEIESPAQAEYMLGIGWKKAKPSKASAVNKDSTGEAEKKKPTGKKGDD